MGVQRWRPRPGGQPLGRLMDRGAFVGGESDRVLDRAATHGAELAEPVQQPVRRAGGVGADQDSPPPLGGDLGDRPTQHLNVVAGVVGVRVPGPQRLSSYLCKRLLILWLGAGFLRFGWCAGARRRQAWPAGSAWWAG